MSTLPVTFTDSESLLMEDQQPSNQDRVLLIVEALAATMILMGEIIIVFDLGKLSLPLDDSPSLHLSLPELFSILSCTSAITLFGSMCSVARGEHYLIKAWHVLFHMPFLVTACYLGCVALQGPFPHGMCFPISRRVYINDLLNDFISPL
jgi:hypothetical protein